MSKDLRSRYLKRKAKIAQRPVAVKVYHIKPYDGEKYRHDDWTPLVFATESAVYEAILLTHEQLSNDDVQTAFTELAGRLQDGQPPTLSENEQEPPVLDPANAAPFIVWNIRHHWMEFFETNQPVAIDDLVGVLRTLLYSIKAQRWHSGPGEGYVSFLKDFMERSGLGFNVHIEELAEPPRRAGGWGRA